MSTYKTVKTIANFIEALKIFAKHSECGMEEAYFMDAQHDVIYGIGLDVIPPDNDDGKKLDKLGWHEDEDWWAYFT